MAAHDRGVAVGMVGIGVVVLAIRDPETAAEIDVTDRMAVGSELPREFREQREGFVERREIGELGADVHVDAGDVEPRQPPRLRIDLAGARQRDAELVLGASRRNLGVGLGVDIGIDAKRDRRAAALRRGDG